MRLPTAQNIIGTSGSCERMAAHAYDVTPLLFVKLIHDSIHTSRHGMAKTSPEQQLKSFVGVRLYLLLHSGRFLIEDVQKTPRNKFTFDSERDSPESEICRELGKDGRDCMTVCGPCPVLCFTKYIRLPTPVEDGL